MAGAQPSKGEGARGLCQVHDTGGLLRGRHACIAFEAKGLDVGRGIERMWETEAHAEEYAPAAAGAKE